MAGPLARWQLELEDELSVFAGPLVRGSEVQVTQGRMGGDAGAHEWRRRLDPFLETSEAARRRRATAWPPGARQCGQGLGLGMGFPELSLPGTDSPHGVVRVTR